jgi:hypothetical protein
MAVTRIKNNQITDATIFANVKIAPGTIVGSLFNPDVLINSNIAIVGNLTVNGNTNTINSTNTLVNDPLVIFNNGYTGIPAYDVGILVDRNLQPTSPTNYGARNTAWVWRESDGSFQGVLTTETGTTQGQINRSAYANLTIGNTIIQTTATDPSVVEAVDTSTGALQVKGGASFTQNIHVGSSGSFFGANTGVVAIDSNIGIVQVSQENSTRYGFLITDTVNNGALALRTSTAKGAEIHTFSGTNKDIYIQPDRKKSLWLPAGNAAVIADNNLNSINANTGAVIVTGLGGVGVGGNLNIGGAASFASGRVTLDAAANSIVLTGNTATANIGYFNTIIGQLVGSGTFGSNATVVGYAALSTTATADSISAFGTRAGLTGPGANTTIIGSDAGFSLTSTAQNNQLFGWNSGSKITSGSYNVVLGSHDGNTIATLSDHMILSSGSGAPRINIDNTGNVWVVSTNDSTSPTTGALVINGGVGIRGNLNVGSNSITINSVTVGGNADIGGGKVYFGNSILTEAVAGNTVVIGNKAAASGVGAFSVIVGDSAGTALPGEGTTFVGEKAGRIVTGTYNQFFGVNAGRLVTTGNNNVILGANTGTTIATVNNRIIIADGQGNSRINITDTGSTEITSGVESDSIGTGALIVDGGLSVQKNARIGGNLIVTGELNVIGNITTIDSNFLTLVDPIIELGTSANAGVLTTNDGKDRGLAMHYYLGADREAFLGFQNSTGNLVYLNGAIESGANVYSGSYGSVHFGQLRLSNTTPSTTQTTGALWVQGGVGVEGRITANNVVVDKNLTASGAEAIVTFAPTGTGYVTINPQTTGTIDNMIIGGSTPVPATVTNLVVTSTLTILGSGGGNISPSGNLILNPGAPGDMNNIYIGNITPRQAAFTAANIGQDLVMKAFASNSVLFISPSGNLSVDQRNLEFNFQRQTANTFSTVGLHIGTNGDFGGSDTVNIYYQGDSYLPHSAIAANTHGQVPGWTVSSSRGSQHSPANSVDGDVVGTFGAYAYTGLGAWDEISGIRTVVQGATNALNGIGGELQFWTKRDNSSHTLAVRIDNNQKTTFTGQVSVANSTTSTTTSSGALYVQGGTAIGGNLNVSQGARINDQQNHNRDFVARGGNDATLIWASTASGYNQVLIGNSAVSANLVTGAKLQVNSTDSLLLPRGTEAQRPGVVGYGSPSSGMIRFNTIANDLEYWDGAKWFQPQAALTSTIVADTFSGDGLTTQYTLSRLATTAGTFIAINGTLQQPVAAYSISGNVVTFTEAPAPGDVISARHIAVTTTSGFAAATGLVTIQARDEGVLITGANAGASANSVMFYSDHTIGHRGTTEITVNTTPVLIHTFSADRFRSAKYVVQVQNATRGAHEVSDIMVIHDDTTAFRTQYNMICTQANAAPLGNVSVALSSGNVNLYYTGNSTGNRVKVRADMLSKYQEWESY